jgi:porin
MNNRIRAKLIALLLLSGLCAINRSVRAQDPAASPLSSPEAAATKPAPPPAAAPAPTPETDFWKRAELTGDWSGDRLRLKEEGLVLEGRFTQFYQGIASGGTRENSVYNAKLELEMKLDFGKMNPKWQWWSAAIKTEWRFGGPLLLGTGGLNPTNTATLIPGSSGSVVSVTAFNFTRIIPRDLKKGNVLVVGFGRYNMVELIDEHFFAGEGTERFLNLAQIGPLTVLREVPFVTNGATFAVVKGGEPRFVLAVIDPNDHSADTGLDDLFADGVTFAPAYNFPAKYWGKSAKHTIGGAITTKKYTPFDAIRQIILPGPPLNPVQPKRGSWNISYTFRQYVVERSPKNGWGFFTQVAFANKDTSPITRLLDIGLGGNGLFKSRPTDEFGISYAYTGLSSVLVDNINLLTLGGRRPRSENQIEMFYNFHIAPWLRLTGDIQFIRGVRRNVDTAVVPGARLELIF